MIGAINGSSAMSALYTYKPPSMKAGVSEEAKESSGERLMEMSTGEEPTHKIDVYA